ncbi:MAG: hypothetical protein U9Q74_05275 [Gemmatimonadota bacterium]|nr:hypothetical protein [Gemmatimonadota bacterium]
MNQPTFRDILGVHARQPDEFEYPMRLGMLREIAEELRTGAEWRAQCDRLVAELAALRARLP